MAQESTIALAINEASNSCALAPSSKPKWRGPVEGKQVPAREPSLERAQLLHG